MKILIHLNIYYKKLKILNLLKSDLLWLHYQLKMKEEIIDDISCPITREIMIEPVVLSDGHTYEKEAIKIWLREHNTSPKTNKPLILGKHFNTNFTLKKTINTIMKLNILGEDVITTYKEKLDRYNLNIGKPIFKLFIKTLSGRNYQLDVTVDTTISDIFDEQIIDLPKDQVMLIYERKYLPSYLLKFNPAFRNISIKIL